MHENYQLRLKPPCARRVELKRVFGFSLGVAPTGSILTPSDEFTIMRRAQRIRGSVWIRFPPHNQATGSVRGGRLGAALKIPHPLAPSAKATAGGTPIPWRRVNASK